MAGSKNYAPQEYDVVHDTISELKRIVRDIQGCSGAKGDYLCADAMEMINFMQTDESFYLWSGDIEAEIERILDNAGLSIAEIHHRAMRGDEDEWITRSHCSVIG